MDPNKQKAALALKNDTSRSVAEICQILAVSRNTYYKYVLLDDRQPGVKGKTAAETHREQ
jgi:DNA-binding CsgD family transcriptional regulator